MCTTDDYHPTKKRTKERTPIGQTFSTMYMSRFPAVLMGITLVLFAQNLFGQFGACANNNDTDPPYTVAQSTDPLYTIPQGSEQVNVFLELATAVIGPGYDFCIGNDPGVDTQDGCGTFLFTGLDSGQAECGTEFCFSPRQGCGDALGNVCIFIEDPDNPGDWLKLGAPDGSVPNNEVCVVSPPGVDSFAITICRPGQGPVSVNDLILTTPPTIDVGPDKTVCDTDVPTTIDLTVNEPPGQSGGTWEDGGGPIADPTAVPINGVVGDMFTFTYTYDAEPDVGFPCLVSDEIKYTITDVCCEFFATCNLDATEQVIEGCDISALPAPFTLPSQVFTDITTTPCGALVLTHNDVPTGTLCPSGLTVERTYTLFDDLNNNQTLDPGEEFETCVENFRIVDTTPPTFTVPDDVTLSCEQDFTDLALTGDVTDESDNCSTGIEAIPSDDTSGLTGCNGTGILVRTWTLVDDCLNTTTKTQTVTIQDTIDPAFDTQPGAIADISCSDTLPTQETLTASDDCGNATVTPSVDPFTVDTCNGYSVTYRWTAEDDCGNTTVATQSFNVLPDTAPPVIDGSLAADLIVECDGSGNTAELQVWLDANAGATASDDCHNVSWSHDYTALTDDLCGAAGSALVTFTATDECGNSSTIQRTVTIQDTIDPAFDTQPGAIADISCSDTLPTQETLTASDDCGNATVTPSVDPFTVDTCNGYSVTYRWTAEDDCGNTTVATQSFNVLPDTAPPVIDGSLAADLIVECDGSGNTSELQVWLDANAGATASDDCHNVSWSHDYTALTDDLCGAAGSALVTFTATDECGNSSTIQRTVTIQDTIDPAFDTQPGAIADISCSDTLPTQETLTASDDCGNATVTPSVDPFTVDTCNGYSVTYRWTAEDDCGNTTVATQSFNVLPDTAPPVIDGSLAADLIVECDGSGNTSELQVWLDANAGATASDDCHNVSWSHDYTALTDDLCGAAGSALVTFTATDECGNSSTIQRTVTIQDTIDPAFDTQPGAIADISCSDTLPTQETLTASDDCGNATVTPSVDPFTVDTCNGYSVTYRWTAEDDCGNTTVATQSFNVLPDTAPPVIDGSLAADLIVECDGSGNTAELQVWLDANAGATASDDCHNVSWSHDYTALTDDLCGAAGSALVTFTATDECGNSSTIQRTVTIQDTIDPAFDTQPGAIADISCSDTLPTQETLTASDDCGNATVTPSVDPFTVDTCNGYSVTYRWTAEDDCGNTTVATQSFNVLPDTAPPVIDGSLAADLIVECDGSGNTAELQVWLDANAGATASDDCHNVSWSHDYTALTDDLCGAAGSALVTFTATDECGNSSTIQRTVTIQDTIDPAFDTQPGAIADISCSDTLPTQETLTASDDCGNATVTPSVDPFTVDTCNGYSVTYRWTAEDDCGNTTVATQSFNVLPDTAPPVIDGSLAADLIVECDGSGNTSELQVWLDANAGATASDDCHNVSWSHDYTALTDDLCGAAGSALVTFTATDECDNSSTIQRTVTIQDTIDPAFDTQPGAIADISCSDTLPTQETLTASDDCGNATVTPSVDPFTVDTCNGYSVTYRWTAEDDCGNTTVATQSFNVLPDTAPPVIDGSLAADLIVECDGSGNTSELQVWLDANAGATASDDCHNVSWSHDYTALTDDLCGAAGSALVTFTATDECDNSSTIQRTVTIQDTIDPAFDTQPGAIADISCSDTLPTQETLTASDDCGNATVTPSVDPFTVDTCNGYSVTYRWTAEDDCGNTTVATQSFNVLPDTAPPVIDGSLAADLIVECDGSGNTAELQVWLDANAGATASDDCHNVSWSHDYTALTDDLCGAAGSALVTFTATDECDNSSTIQRTVTIQDTIDPAFDTQPGAIADISCSDTLPTQETLTASDDCGNATVTPSVDPFTVDTCKGYSVTYRWTAEDDCGNTTVATQSFNVLPDTAPPVIDGSLAADLIVECDGSGNTAELQVWLDANAGATASDDCHNVSWSHDYTALTDDLCGAAGSALVTFTATDECDNSSTIQRTVTIQDTIDPAFDTQPGAIADISCSDTLPTQETLTASDDCGNATVTPSVDPFTVDTCNGYSVTYRWTAEDDCGNTTVATQSFNVLPDTAPPVIDGSLAADLIVECDGSGNTAELQVWLDANAGATASDDCHNVSWSHDYTALTDDLCGAAGSALVTFTATDECGNSSTIQRTFTIEDTIDPAFDTQPAAIADISCSDTLPTQETLTASDDCGNATVTPSVDPFTVDTCNGYSVTYRWTAEDDCGNTTVATQSFAVLPDTAPPVIDGSLAADLIVECDGSGNTAELQVWLDANAGATASDDCHNVTWSHDYMVLTDDLCGAAGSALVTFTATDECGNSSTIQRTFTIEDTIDPAFDTQPAAIADISCSDTLPTQETLTASDDCGNATVTPSVDPFTVDTCNGYSVTYRWTAEDDCGNTTVATQSFNVLPDTAPPVIDGSLAADLIVECDGSGNTAELQVWLDANAGATASDDCHNVTWSHDYMVLTDDLCGAAGSALVTFTATDECGNSSTIQRTFTIEDTIDPAFDTQPAAIADISCSDTLPTQETLTASDDCGNATVTPSVDPFTVDTCNGYSVTYRWTAEDDCGNTTVATQSFAVLPDTAPPVIDGSLAADLIVECDGSGNTAELQVWLDANAGATASDDCHNVTWSHDYMVLTDDLCGAAGSALVTFTATDECGNSSTIQRTFTIEDTIDPAFDTQPAAIADISCSDTLPTQETLTASDDCGNATVTPSVDPFTVDTCNGYSVTYRWTAEDDCGNTTVATQSFAVLPDTAPPVIDGSLAADLIVECDGSGNTAELQVWLDANAGATASDDCHNVTWSHDYMVLTDDLCGAAGSALVTFTATDECGNSSTIQRTFTIEDTIDPAFDTQPAAIADISCSDTLPTQETLTASDDCGNATVTPSVDPFTVDTCNGYSVTYRWTAEDDCGNTTVATQSFAVLPDTAPPVIDGSLAADLIVECDGSGNTAELQVWLDANAGATASDDCHNVSWSHDYMVLTDDLCGAAGSATVTFTATDECGNSSTIQRTFTIEDVTPPTIDVAASDLTVQCDGAGNMDELNAWLASNGTTGEASDICSGVEWSNDFTGLSDDCGATGSATVTFTATDDCGNSSSTSATFTIGDGTPPTIDTMAADANVECDGLGNDAELQAWLNSNGGAAASDVCGGVTWSNDFSGLSDDCGATGSATVTFTATDDCGHTVTTSATFTIEDTTAPTITVEASDLTVECDGAGNAAELNNWLNTIGITGEASDDCSGVTWTNDFNGLSDDCGETGSALVTFTATDDCGHTVTTSATFTIEDTIPPAITCPADAKINCGGDDSPGVTGYPTATDACDEDSELVFDFTDSERESFCDAITRTWVAIDACGNVSDTCTQEISTCIDLSIVKTFDPAEVPQGTMQSFTIEVSNAVDQSDALDVSVTDMVDDSLAVTGVTVTSGSGDCSASAGQVIDCTVDIPAGESVIITVDYTAAPFLSGDPSPYGTQSGDDFRFVFVNGSVLEGSTDGGPVFLDGVDITADVMILPGLTRNDLIFDPPGTDPAFELHLSCSDPFTGGWGQSGGPVEGVDVNWQIAFFSIARYNSQGFFKSCGNVVNPFDVPNIATATGLDSAGTQTVSDDATVTIEPGITLDRLQTNGKRLTVRLTNFTGEDKVIEDISIDWPASNGNLKKIRLDEPVVWSGDVEPTSALLDATDPGWNGGTLLTGEAILRFDFANKSADSGYTIRVNFTDGTFLDIMQ